MCSETQRMLTQFPDLRPLQLSIRLSNSGTLHIIPSLSSPTEDYGSYQEAGKGSFIPHFIGQRHSCAHLPSSKPHDWGEL